MTENTAFKQTVESFCGSGKASLLCRRWTLPAIALLLLGVGGWFAWRTAQMTDARLRATLLAQTRLAASGLEPDEIAALTGTPTDQSSPTYKKMKAQLARMRAANPECRFLYLMGRKPDGSVFFFVDSEPVGSEDESPPGQVYTEASDMILRVFESGEAAVEGPIRDRWGTWVSGLVPLEGISRRDAAIVFGMDIEAGDWNAAILRHSAVPVGLALLSILAAGFALAALRHIALRRVVEDDLRESREDLAVTLRSIGDGVIVTDRTGRIADMNPAAEALTGWPLADAKGKPLAEVFRIVNEDTRASVDNPVEKVLREGGVVGLANHTLLIARDGTERPIADSAAPIRLGSERELRGVVLVFRDVSDERSAERALKQKQRQIEFILGATRTGLDIIDADFNIRYIDPEWRKVYGDPAGRKCYAYFMDRDGICPGCGLVNALETRCITVAEEVLPKEGNRPIQVTTIPYQDDKGEWLVAEVNVDISERVKVENRLTRLNECFLSFGPDSKANIDKLTELAGELFGGACALYNRLSGGMLCTVSDWNAPPDMQRKDVPEGHICYDVIQGGSGTAFLAADLQHSSYAQSDPNVAKYDLSAYFGQAVRVRGESVGSLCVVYGHDFAPGAEDRKLIGILASAIGMEEERLAAEMDLKRNNDSLIDLNARLQENQKQLVQSEKMASIGQLAAGVAHEINNPVGFIKSNLGTLAEYVGTFKALLHGQEGLLEAAEANDAARMVECAEFLRNLREGEDLDFVLVDVDQLLSESRDGTDRVRDIVLNLKSFARLDEAELKDADINEGIEATLKIVWNELKYKAEVTKDLKPLPRIRCYPGQLNQVFVNLLVNAAQAIPERGEIRIVTEAEPGEVRICISDTGTGIEPEVLPKLFDPFFTTKDTGKGTGLGLSISHGIVEKHGGRIEVDSAPGKGTTFTVILPIEGVADE